MMRSTAVFTFAALVIGLVIGFGAGRTWRRPMAQAAASPASIYDAFHREYYNSNIMEKAAENTHWLGVKTMKLPLDAWVFQEIIWETKPDVIIECGTNKGGSALYMATMLDEIGKGHVYTVDIVDMGQHPTHGRISYLLGSSTSPEIEHQITSRIKKTDKVMVVLDSDHHKAHVLNELRVWSKYVTPGAYLIVEDTNINGHPVYPDFGPGPAEAVAEFLKESPQQFDVDRSREKFGISFNPGGYLRKN